MYTVGVLTLLKFPYPRCVEEPETYDQVRVHAEWGAATSRPDSQKPTFAVSHHTTLIYIHLDHSRNEYCDLIGHKQVSTCISHKKKKKTRKFLIKTCKFLT